MFRTFLKYWLPVVVWSVLILIASGSGLSSEHTAPILGRILLFFGHPLPPVVFDMVHFVIRRLGHIFEYTVLSLLTFRAVRGDREGTGMRWAFATVAICFAVACSDEFRQSFAVGRTATPQDVVLDTAAAALAQAVVLLRNHGRRQAARGMRI